jgi:hypothetical protein
MTVALPKAFENISENNYDAKICPQISLGQTVWQVENMD